MNSARENILNRLQQNTFSEIPEVPLYAPVHHWTQEQKIEKFSRHIQAVHAEVHRVKNKQWIECLKQIVTQKSIQKLLLSQQTEMGMEIAKADLEHLTLLEYKQSMEQWKGDFFTDVTAGLTTTMGAIAETGSLMLWPTIAEPRLISLVPPIHIALLDADKIYDTFAQAVQEQKWADTMPTNALLISGPSKTADIEQVLAYGVHGPKELVVLIRE